MKIGSCCENDVCEESDDKCKCDSCCDDESKSQIDICCEKEKSDMLSLGCCDSCCTCNSGSSSEESKTKKSLKVIGFISGIILYLLAMLVIQGEVAKLCLFGASYLLIGGQVIYSAVRNIFRGKVFDENFLMVIATVGAFCIKEYPEAVAVMIFYEIGRSFQDKAINKSKKSIKALMDIRPDYANVVRNGREVVVSPEDVKIGESIIVKNGERIPLDGVLDSEVGAIDTSAITGESMIRDVLKGDNVLSGCINKGKVIKLVVSKEFKESTVSKILELVENASSKKAETEKFITRFARYYTPLVVALSLSLSLIPPIITGGDFHVWLYRGLSFLVVSCPCALVISIPLGFFGGIGCASKNGILVKGGNYLERLKDVDTIVFDKTGTITKGIFTVTEINAFDDISKEELLELAAYGEAYSNHPIAKSIIASFNKEIDKSKIEDYEELSGHGTRVKYKNRDILVGNHKLMTSNDIIVEEVKASGTIVYVAADNKCLGYIIISDEIKSDVRDTIKKLKKLGVKKTVMLTGDNDITAKKVSNEAGIDTVYSELLPTDKVDKIEEIFEKKDSKGSIIFVGDGINDAPVLARADIGIAMGGIGTDAAIEASDVVIMNDELSKVAEAIEISRATNRIVWQNIIFSLTIKIAILILIALGMGNMWEAVFADVGVALVAVLNSVRILK